MMDSQPQLAVISFLFPAFLFPVSLFTTPVSCLSLEIYLKISYSMGEYKIREKVNQYMARITNKTVPNENNFNAVISSLVEFGKKKGFVTESDIFVFPEAEEYPECSKMPTQL